MNVKLIAALVAGALSTAPAFSTTLDFEGLTDGSQVGNAYAGISFGGDAIVDTNTVDFTYFTNGTGSSAFTSVGPSAFVNVGDGFTGTVSFNYSAIGDSTFNVYSDLNGGAAQPAYQRAWSGLSGSQRLTARTGRSHPLSQGSVLCRGG